MIAPLAQIVPHPWNAIGAPALFKTPGDQHAQLGISLATLTIVLVPMRAKNALAHLEGLDQRVGGILMFELFHHREPCGGISADKMPKAFITWYEP